ncbi:MAG: CotH kinase family protein [Kiritimatiellae bacterium]|nr:CotH kinase family protein [Kiritimatiellia bacterium]
MPKGRYWYALLLLCPGPCPVATASDAKAPAAPSAPPLPQVAAPHSSHERGVYHAPFDVSLTTRTHGASIRYTTDGSRPTATNGEPGGTNAVLRIARTTCLRAAAFKCGYIPSPTMTHTYLFIESVLDQHAPPDYPETWVGPSRKIAADYDMDPEMVNHPDSRRTVRTGFAAIPTLSIAIDKSDLFAEASGVYCQGAPDPAHNVAKPASAELIYPREFPIRFRGFQVDCGLRPHSHFLPKRSLRLVFKKQFGPAKLRYPFFESAPLNAHSAAERFDKIVLRAGCHDAWPGATSMDPASCTLVRDQWARDSLIAMTGYGPHGIFVHLYINGLYWGIYNAVERPDHAFAAEYFGGSKEQWFACNHNFEYRKDSIHGDASPFLAFLESIKHEEAWPAIQRHLDAPRFSDYVILAWYSGMGDWPKNNWHATMRTTPPGPARFFTWDAEKTWYDLRCQDAHEGGWIQPPFTNDTHKARIAVLWRDLWSKPAFRMQFADRLYSACSAGGPLHDEASVNRWQTLANLLDPAIVCESARWGDAKESITASSQFLREPDWTFPVYTREHWRRAVERVNDLMVGNADRFLDVCRNTCFQSHPILPSLLPPRLSRESGEIRSGFQFSLRNPNADGTVFFTTDGTDPRAQDGAPADSAKVYSRPIVLSMTSHVRARVCRSTGTWSPLCQATYDVPDQHRDLRITELMCHPPAGKKCEFIQLKNTASTPRGLSGMFFTRIRYAFPPGAQIEPGQMLVLSADAQAFQREYGFVPFGEYRARLRNAGEPIVLKSVAGASVAIASRVDETP